MSRFLGVDPGKSGAIAVLDGYGEIESIDDMPVVGSAVSGSLLCDLIDNVVILNGGDSEYSLLGVDVVAIVEQVHSMPKQGVASSFDFGKSYGIVLGVLAGAHVRTEHVSPQRWKKVMRLTADKEQARRRAIERWPKWSDSFKRKKDADRAEAALLALWFIEQGARAATHQPRSTP